MIHTLRNGPSFFFRPRNVRTLPKSPRPGRLLLGILVSEEFAAIKDANDAVPFPLSPFFGRLRQVEPKPPSLFQVVFSPLENRGRNCISFLFFSYHARKADFFLPRTGGRAPPPPSSFCGLKASTAFPGFLLTAMGDRAPHPPPLLNRHKGRRTRAPPVVSSVVVNATIAPPLPLPFPSRDQGGPATFLLVGA